MPSWWPKRCIRGGANQQDLNGKKRPLTCVQLEERKSVLVKMAVSDEGHDISGYDEEDPE